MEKLRERRELPRRRVLKGAIIVFNNGTSTFNCTVRNLTDKGAKLTIDTIVGVPDRFLLKLVGESARPCRVAWQANRELGVLFEEAAITA